MPAQPAGEAPADDGCTLCDLPTPEPPVTEAGVEGTYCCRGCLAVARSLDEPAAMAPDAAREAVGSDGASVPEDAETAFVRVDGMHCTSCEAFLESRAERDDAVHRAAASYASELVRVEYDGDALAGTTDGDPAAAVAGLFDAPGYTARPAEEGPPDTSESLGRLLVGGFVAMMVMLWYALFLYPAYLGVPTDSLLFNVRDGGGRYLLWNVWAFATLVLGYTGAPILRGAYVSLRAGRPNMDLLVATAATTAYLYSTLVLLTGGIDVYFDVSVVVLVAVSIGGYYERRIRRRAAGRLTDLTGERVETARRVVDGDSASGVESLTTETVSVDVLSAGDEVVVDPGERIPTDGTVVAGQAGVDESLVTGEAAPRRVEPGDEVVGGALATDGSLRVRSTGESTVDRLTHHLWDVQAASPGAQRLADRLAAVFVPLVFLIAAVAFGWTLLSGGTPTGALLTALAVLVVSCPCAMGLATPLAVAAVVRDALDRGIVVTDPSVFETSVAADVVAFDKTGTLTEDEMSLVEWTGSETAMARAAAVERRADHPVAAAVTGAFDPAGEARGFRTHPGRGVSAVIDGDRVYVGGPALFDSLDGDWTVPEECRECAATGDGGLAAYVGWDGTVRAALLAAERPREEWADAVSGLAADDRRIVVLSGDGEAALAPFADHPDVDETFAGVPPEGKAETVERLRTEGTVAMVGDGSNDAPALAAADLGVALRTGTELAADAADAVVIDDDLRRVVEAFDLTSATRTRVRENLGWALCYNAVAVPAAALGFVSPLLAAVAMAASSLLVVTNSARPVLPEDETDTEAGDDDGSGGNADDTGLTSGAADTTARPAPGPTARATAGPEREATAREQPTDDD